MYLHENTSFICSDVKKESLPSCHCSWYDTDARALISKSVRWYCNGWKSGGKTAPGGYSMPKQTVSLTSLKKMGPDLLVHQDLPHKCISRGEFTKVKKKWQHLVLKTCRGCNSASWSTTGPSESCSDIFLLGNSSHDHVIDGKKKINILLMFSYLCVTEFLKFHVYGNVIKRIKGWQCVFCYVSVFSNYLKKSVVITSVWRMPNKHCNING